MPQGHLMGLWPPAAPERSQRPCPPACPWRTHQGCCFFGTFCSVSPSTPAMRVRLLLQCPIHHHVPTSGPAGHQRSHISFAFPQDPVSQSCHHPQQSTSSRIPAALSKRPTEGKTTPLGHEQPAALPARHLCGKDTRQSPAKDTNSLQEGFQQPLGRCAQPAPLFLRHTAGSASRWWQSAARISSVLINSFAFVL